MQQNHYTNAGFVVDVEKRLGKKSLEGFYLHFAHTRVTTFAELCEWLHKSYVRNAAARAEGAKRPTASVESRFTAEEAVLGGVNMMQIKAYMLNAGIETAWKTGDFVSVYQYAETYVRLAYAEGPALAIGYDLPLGFGSGYDHCFYMYESLTALACLRPDFAKKFLPEEKGLSTNGYPLLVVCCNLLMGLLHGRRDFQKEAGAQAEKFLAQKHSQSEKAAVAYLVAVYEQNVEVASEQLAILMRLYPKNEWLKNHVQSGGNAMLVYGFYFTAKLFWPEDLFARLVRPADQPGWWDEYIELCQDSLPPIEQAPVFPENLDFLNQARNLIEREAVELYEEKRAVREALATPREIPGWVFHQPEKFVLNVEKRLGRKIYERYFSIQRHTFSGMCDAIREHLSKLKELKADPGNPNAKLALYSAEDYLLRYGTAFSFSNTLLYQGLEKAWTTGDFVPALASVDMCVRLRYAQYPAMERRYEPQELENGRQCGYFGLASMALACMRPDFARKILPADAGLCMERLNATMACGNLLTAMLHGRDDLLQTALELAKERLSLERKKLDIATIAFLVAVAEHDVDAATEQLNLAMKAFSGLPAPELDDNDAANALPIYGLYFAAKCYWPEGLFARLGRPSKRPGWWDEYVDVCLDASLNGPLPGAVFPFPGDLDFLNKALVLIEE